jgi:long-subunit acyl-CoA synthetase (AMP-forming)
MGLLCVVLCRDQILEGITMVKPTLMFVVPMLLNKVLLFLTTGTILDRVTKLVTSRCTMAS